MNLMDTVQRWKGAAMAQAAHLNQIPFIILRAISDKADQVAAGSYEEFEKRQ